MGSLIAEAPNAEKIEHLVAPIKDLFGAVFFVSVGMMVDPAILIEQALPIFVLVVATIIGKLIFSTGGVLASGQSSTPLCTAASAWRKSVSSPLLSLLWA